MSRIVDSIMDDLQRKTVFFCIKIMAKKKEE